MKISRIPFHQVPQLSKIDVAYAGGDDRLRPFFRHEVSLAQFREVIESRRSYPVNREVLVSVLRSQYAGLEPVIEVNEQISLLERDNTFTVATAHQPCLFTGPLYYVYKIFSCINLADQLNLAYPEYRFVPVFVSGAEDHDFEEINKVHLFNKTLVWENEENGPAGGMSTSSLGPVLASLEEVLGTSGAEIFSLIEQAYTTHATFGRATVHLLHALFGSYGLVVADMNAPELKRLFVPLMERELLEHPSRNLVEAAQAGLEAFGFGAQAHAREINLFYMRRQLRERIVLEEGLYKVLDTDYTFTKDAMMEELRRYPERFSPNVVMRPLYQETVLPNLAYIGGGGEIAYWLERLEQFRYFGTPFPMLVRRNSVWWIDESGSKRMEKLGLQPEHLFEDTEALVKQYVAANTEHEISLSFEKEQLQALFSEILRKAAAVDSTLEKAVLAEQAKQLNALEHLEAKMLRAEKQRQDTAVQQIRSLKEKYFPGNGLQERYDNFLPLYLKYGKAFFDTLRTELDPLAPGFVVLSA